MFYLFRLENMLREKQASNGASANSPSIENGNNPTTTRTARLKERRPFALENIVIWLLLGEPAQPQRGA
jgi:hypothetical protein